MKIQLYINNKRKFKVDKTVTLGCMVVLAVSMFTGCTDPINEEANERAVNEYTSAQVYAAVSNFNTETEAQDYLHKRGIYVDLSGYYEEEKTYDTPFSK